MGIDPSACVYVGDAERDMQAAQAAGMFGLVAGYGYLGDGDRADEWFSHGWLDTPLELLSWIDEPSPAKRAADGGAKRATNVNGIA
jgi:N-acetyl-D-muramate 6-phosphate phosphatase